MEPENETSDRERKRRRRIQEDSDEDEETEENLEEENQDMGSYVSDKDEDEEISDAEDLVEDAMKDYVAIPELDTYGTQGIDDRDFDPLSKGERMAAEEELDRRDRIRRGDDKRLHDWLEVDEEDDERRLRRGRFAKADRIEGDQGDDGVEQEAKERDSDDEDIMEAEGVNLEAFDVPLQEWIADLRTRREIQRRFRRFLYNFRESSNAKGSADARKNPPLYDSRIKDMARRNGTSLDVSYLHLYDQESLLVDWLVESPQSMLEILDESVTRHTLKMFPSYPSIVQEKLIRVRICDVPVIDSIRMLRNEHLFKLVRIVGVVTRRTSVYPKIKTAYYNCNACQTLLGPFDIDDSSHFDSSSGIGTDSNNKPPSCHVCIRRNNDANNEQAPTTFSCKINTHKSLYRNYQRINLQESPNAVPPGRIPRSKEVVLSDDLIDVARPGEEVEITGVYMHAHTNIKTLGNSFPVFSTLVFANHVRKRHFDENEYESHISESDKKDIVHLSRQPNVTKRLVKSIAPSIYGHEHVKMAIALALFGGNPKSMSTSKVRIRGDINVLLLGDPGTAKSQFLKYSEKTSHRSVYSTGKGASAVGLTASVRRDPLTREWTLEGGALVLADQGVCLIDEFDKMNDQDRTSIHEAMEQQSISISKAGIITSLQARCSVIAAANPIGGRYDASVTLAENVELTDPILQRFDILCVLQDEIDPENDERLATFVSSSHMKSKPVSDSTNLDMQLHSLTAEESQGNEDDSSDPDIIPQSLLRKYIRYARSTIRPILRPSSIDQEKISSLYVALRRESQSSGGVPIAVRHIESILRMSEAHAKMHLRDYVREDDIDAAIRVMLHSFIQAQKFSVRRLLTAKFAKFITEEKGTTHLLLHILQQLMRNERLYQTVRLRRSNQNNKVLDDNDEIILQIPVEEFQTKARESKIYDVSTFLLSEEFKSAGYNIKKKRDVEMIVKSFVSN